jgi:DNA-binding transcriptional ArsR family regulator
MMNRPPRPPRRTASRRPGAVRPAARPAGIAPDELALVFDAVARYFGLLAEPTRLSILHAICNDELPVSAIVEATGATQTNVSRHLGLLHAAGVVTRRRAGSSVHYRVADSVFVEICRTVCVRIAGRIDAQSPLKIDLLDFARSH